MKLPVIGAVLKPLRGEVSLYMQAPAEKVWATPTEVLRIADKEVDLAFATALVAVSRHPVRTERSLRVLRRERRRDAEQLGLPARAV